ncbi:hypothetical protein FB567DRAFT_576092 [Paraphoma chrysanthemicola]|uniref:Uncharacterized protein n=1 Tax=Paraphoma chrysanthemicola TaxID=798071 RepID=A0A8K0RG23_9PLEO|nr:hypothetical protein FB567DRAFT_576092 [Paraphoma chrysanthemicola]
MHLSTITTLAALGLTASALQININGKRQTNKFDGCTNSGDERCNDGETRSAKRQTEKFDKRFNYGEEWCNDGKVLTCKKVPFVDQGRVKSTHKTCATKRDIGDWCDKNGVIWCQDYQILTCSIYRITPTGAGCGTKRSVEVESRGRKFDINILVPPVIPKTSIPKPDNPLPLRPGSKRSADPQGIKSAKPIIPPVAPVVPEPVNSVPPRPFGVRDVDVEARGWKPDVNVPTPTKPDFPMSDIPEVSKSQFTKPVKRDLGDRCDKAALGKTWCQDSKVLECADLEGLRWGVVKSTGEACSA